nr:MAG TPA: hypothetical protein [Caudoviricetes sp.]
MFKIQYLLKNGMNGDSVHYTIPVYSYKALSGFKCKMISMIQI